MKISIFFFTALIILMLLACSNNKSGKTQNEDPAKITVPSNSDATNPSLADTAYSKLKRDSVKNIDTLNNK
jgi:hypothetical protein